MKTVKDGNLYKAVKQVERFYWKREETEQSWTQPVLSANGTIGGDSFACVASGEKSSYYAWKAFNNNTSDYWHIDSVPSWIEWYNPNPLKITKVVFTTGEHVDIGNRYAVKNYKIQASDDGNSWVDIYTGTNSSTGTRVSVTANISNNNFYKYWRIYVSSINAGNGAEIWEVSVTATQLQETITPGTAEDYDFYTDEDVYKGVNL